MTKTNPRMLSPATLAKQARVGEERHTIETIDYTFDKMTCSCGEWEGPALDIMPFRAHRREFTKARPRRR